MDGRGVVSRPFDCCFPSAASGAPSPAPAALASPGAGSVASLGLPAPLGPAVQWEGCKGWGGEGGAWVEGVPKAEAGPEGRDRRRIGAEAQSGEGGGALDLSRAIPEVTSPWGQRPAQSELRQHTGMAKRCPQRAA